MYKKYDPKNLIDFIGQENILADLSQNLKAALIDNRAMGHVLFAGGAGLGKTTLARIIANEMKSRLFEYPAASIKQISQLDYMIYQMKRNDILFIDEIHNLKASHAENMYTLLESGVYNGVKIQPFTLIGATNYAGNIDKPLRDRMVHKYTFKEYTVEDLTKILVLNGAPVDVAREISIRSRGIPRLARNFLISISNEATANGTSLDIKSCNNVFIRQEIDKHGLTAEDRNVLAYLRDNGAFDVRRAIGERAICTALSIEKIDFSTIVEPHLMRLGFVGRTIKGRILTRDGIEYMNNETF